ncbi:MAG: hypothetical protein J6X84_02430 [Treponema sp.]|nr:hypothetical protein [Treponema sp.]
MDSKKILKVSNLIIIFIALVSLLIFIPQIQNLLIVTGEKISGHSLIYENWQSRFIYFEILFLELIGISHLLKNYLKFFNTSEIENNKKLIIFSIIFIVLFSSLLLLFPGTTLGHDGTFHLMRIDGLADELRRGNIPVRLQSLWLEGYGYPVSIYYCDILLYFPALLRLIGVPLTVAYKIYILGVNFATVLIAYICFKKIFKSTKIGLILSLVFSTAPYRLVDIFIRNAVGEYSAFIFFPIIALAFFKLYTESKENYNFFKIATLLAIGMSGLVLTHILTTEIVIITLIVICLILWKKTFTKNNILCICLAMFETFLICAFFIIPFIDYFFNVSVKISQMETQYIQFSGVNFIQLFMFFQNPFGKNTTIVKERMLLSPGLPLMMSFILPVIYYCWKNKIELGKKSKNLILLLSCIAFVSLILFLPQVQNLIIALGEKYIGRPLTHDIWCIRFKNYEYTILFGCLFFIICVLFANISKNDYQLKILFIISIIVIFISSNIFPWNLLSLTWFGKIVSQIQFAWRWLGIVIIILTLLTGRILFLRYNDETQMQKSRLNCLHCINGKVLLFLIILQTFPFYFQYQMGSNNVSFNDYSFFGSNVIEGAEYLRDGADIEKFDGKIKTENVQISNINRNANKFRFYAVAQNNGFVELPMLNYKGYHALGSGGENLSIIDGENKVIRILLPKDFDSEIIVYFKQPFIWIIGSLISICSISLIIILMILTTRKKTK